MHLHAITVSVDYAAPLAKSIGKWRNGCDTLTIVTSSSDRATQDLAVQNGCLTHSTGAFYASGASFNKGAAIAEAFDALTRSQMASPTGTPYTADDWFLFFDADMEPPYHWRQQLEHQLRQAANLRPDWSCCIYGCDRYRPGGRKLREHSIARYFLLFNATDPNAQVQPIVADNCK